MCKPGDMPKDEGDYMGVPLATLLDTSMATGLSEEEARSRLARFGRNEVPVETPSRLSVFLRQFSGTMPAMLMLATIFSASAPVTTSVSSPRGRVRLVLEALVQTPPSCGITCS